MPPKIRELKKALTKAGFMERPGKGSHTNWTHPRYQGRITIPGKNGDDAKRYLEKLVKDAIASVTKGADSD